jgi:hypothetical protein
MWLATGGSLMIGVVPIAKALFGPLPGWGVVPLAGGMGAPFGIAIARRMQPDRETLLHFLRVYALIGVFYLGIIGYEHGLAAW